MTTTRKNTNHDVELTDADAAHALTLGSAIGIPAIFAIVLLISLTAGASWTESVVIAAWPAVFGGPFFGALVVLGGVVGRTRATRWSFRSRPNGAEAVRRVAVPRETA